MILNVSGRTDVVAFYTPWFLKRYQEVFLDDYKHVEKNIKILQDIHFTEEDYKTIGTCFSEIAKKNDIKVQTCCEEHHLQEYGFKKGDCLSH